MGLLDDGRSVLEQSGDPRFAPAPGGPVIPPTGASWDAPFSKLWQMLPENVRQAYASAPEGLAWLYRNMSTPGAIQDTTEALQDTARSAMKGEGWDTATNAVKALGAAVGVIPGGKLAVKGGEKLASKIAENVPALAREAGDIRLSTRLPTAVNAYQDPLSHHLNIGLPEIVNSETWAGKNQELLKQWPGFKTASLLADPAAAAESYVSQATDNVGYLMRNAPKIIREESPHWYEGANQFDRMLANRWSVPEQSVHGMTAVLSPKRDWFQNASLSERTGDILAGITKPMTPEMEQAFRSTPALQRYKDVFSNIQGARLSDIQEPIEKALWVQLYDKAHNPTQFRTMSPTGLLGDWARTGQGAPIKIASPTLEQTEKAVRAFESGGDLGLLSPLLGEYHKVRNFYNNLAVPLDRRFGDVTADTHAVAANQFQPLTLNSPSVVQNFGTHLERKKQPEPMEGYAPWKGPSSSSKEGVTGVYGLNVEPYRRVGADYGLLPRATQSVVWDTVRPLFEQLKSSGRGEEAQAIWKAVDRGDISAEQARDRIVELAGGFKDPDWAVPRGLLSGPQARSSYR